jgi:hypothetical protein
MTSNAPDLWIVLLDGRRSASWHGWTGRKAILAGLEKETCKLKSVDIADTNVRQPAPDVAILTYTATRDVKCEEEKVPTKNIRNGDLRPDRALD